MIPDRENPGGTRETEAHDTGLHAAAHDTAPRDVGATHASPLPGLFNLKPYPAYKDSGVPWLGEVPSHWKFPRFGALLQERGEVNSDGHVDKVLSVLRDRGVIPYSEKGNIGNKRSEDITRYKVVRPDDIVVNCMNVIIGSVGLSRYTGCLSPVYYVLIRRSEVDDPRYLNAYFQTKPFQESLVRIGNGIMAHRMRIPMELLKCEPFPRPPNKEQTAIVRFLDHADRRIQRYIRAKEKLIALLDEQKQAIIHQAVTGQIDVRTGQPYPAYKPSGVEWLGDVPEHWEVAALHHRYLQCLGKMLDSKRITGNHSLPYLRNVDVQWDQINTKDLPNMDIPPDEYKRYTVEQGDLLVCEGGEIGRCALWSGELVKCGFQKALHRLRPRNAGQNVPRFLHYTLRAAVKSNAFNDGHLSTIAHLTGDKLRAHRFPFPPVVEQESLVNFIDAVLNQVDRAVSRANRQIDLLHEYRTRLIADVVTGKLDVREAAAALPVVDPLAAEDTLNVNLNEDAA